MLNFINRIFHPQRHPQIQLPEGVLRRVLALGFSRAAPLPGGWRRLRRRAELVRYAPAIIEPVYHDYGGVQARQGMAGARLALDASGMAWRLPWRSSLSTCPLF